MHVFPVRLHFVQESHSHIPFKMLSTSNFTESALVPHRGFTCLLLSLYQTTSVVDFVDKGPEVTDDRVIFQLCNWSPCRERFRILTQLTQRTKKQTSQGHIVRMSSMHSQRKTSGTGRVGPFGRTACPLRPASDIHGTPSLSPANPDLCLPRNLSQICSPSDPGFLSRQWSPVPNPV